MTDPNDSAWHIDQANADLSNTDLSGDLAMAQVYVLAAQAHALIAVAVELRRHNETQEELLT